VCPGTLVRHERDIELGRSTLKFADVSGLIDPTSVTFTSVTEPCTRVLEQNFQFDLVSTDKLLLEYIDQPIVVPRDEQVREKLGSAFDVVGERRQVDFAVDTKDRWMEEEIEAKVRNHKEQPVRVMVKENLYRWSNWKILSKTHELQRRHLAPCWMDLGVTTRGCAPPSRGAL
jgi:hypothetical protein